MLGEKIEAWFLSPASREYFGVESTAFLSANKFTKKSTHWQDELIDIKLFFMSEAIKMTIRFSKFQCLHAMLLL